jgi:hypothetical protein
MQFRAPNCIVLNDLIIPNIGCRPNIRASAFHIKFSFDGQECNQYFSEGDNFLCIGKLTTFLHGELYEDEIED